MKKYIIVALATALAYPMAYRVITIQTAVASIHQGATLNMLIILGAWGYYIESWAKKKWGKLNTKAIAAAAAGTVVIILIFRIMGYKTSLG